MKIFQIDDNKDITGVFAKILPLKGFDYSFVNEGKTGVGKILDGSFDIVFLDLSMPNFSGFEVLEEIKNKKGKLDNIVILTAANITDDEKSTLQSYGIRDIIFKPLSLPKLLDFLNNSKSEISTSIGA